MNLNKIINPVYSAITSYTLNDDGSASAKYSLGTAEEVDDKAVNFQAIVTEYKYISPENMTSISEQPLTADDVGKQPHEIMLDRIHSFLKENGEIRV